MAVYELLNALVGPLAERPAANDPTIRPSGNSGVMYITTDTHQWYLSDGASWTGVGGASFSGCLLASDPVTVTAADHWLAMAPNVIKYTSTDLTVTLGSSLITVNTPGWYRVSAWAHLATAGQDTVYGIYEGDNAVYAESTGFTALSPYPTSLVGAQGSTIQGTGFYRFNESFKTMEFQLHNPGTVDQGFAFWISMEKLFGI